MKRAIPYIVLCPLFKKLFLIQLSICVVKKEKKLEPLQRDPQAITSQGIEEEEKKLSE